MQGSRRRWLTVGVASLALMVAGTASVAARPGEGDDPSGFGFGGPFRQRLEMRDMLRGGWGGFVRTETTYQTDEGGFVTRRIDDGTLSAATDASLDYTLATGEAASVTLDADTEVVAFTSESVDFGRGFHRERLVGEEIAATEIPAGSQIVVSADSQDDGSFLAQRVVVQPAVDETDAVAEEDASTTESTEVAPVASPEPAASATTDA